MKGKYIVIEGGEGAGKDTQIENLRREFGEENFVFTREPGGTRIGKVLRNMLLHESEGPVSLPAEFFLFLGDRAQHVEELIKPMLNVGKNVVSNRSYISFLAYQVYGRQQRDWEDLVRLAIDKIFEDTPIDLAIILDVPYEVGHARMVKVGKELDVIERAAGGLHERVREAFLDIAKTMPAAKVIDASRPAEDVWKDVKEAVQSVL
ncbi:dTMP kinase [Acetobacteraceae bacterium]|nr:dTMP kinase [Candidatus Parcubacteria bacterium]